MKKNTTKLFAMLLLFALAVAAITSCGIVVSGEYRFGLATVEGSDTNIAAAVILDSSDRIALVRIDEIEDGKTTSKKTLGDKYGMLSSWGSSLAEWDDQIAHLERELVGKTAEEISGIKADDADITAGCTVYTGNYIAAVLKAIENAKTSDTFKSTVDHLAISLNMFAGKVSADSNTVVAVCATALSRGYTVAQAQAFFGATTVECKLGFATVSSGNKRVCAAVVVDESGRIVLVSIDEFQEGYSASKKALGAEYGMASSSEIGKEWSEQIAHLESTLIGKSASEVLASDSGNADIAAGCTVYIGNYTKAVAMAMTDAEDELSFSAIVDGLALELTMVPRTVGSATYVDMSAVAKEGNRQIATKSVTATPAEELRFGLATVDTAKGQVAATVVIDASDRVVAVQIDEIDLEYGNNGSKGDLGSDYGMSSASGIGKEWFEQIAHLESELIGKTLDEVLSSSFGDADITAGCTVYIGNYNQAVANAVSAAKSADAFTASKADVVLALSLSAAGSGNYTITAKADLSVNGAAADSITKTATKTV